MSNTTSTKKSKAQQTAETFLDGALTEKSATAAERIEAFDLYEARYRGRKAPGYQEAADYALGMVILHRHSGKVAGKATAKASETQLHPVTARQQAKAAATPKIIKAAELVGIMLTDDDKTQKAIKAVEDAHAADPKGHAFPTVVEPKPATQRTGRIGARVAKPEGKWDSRKVRETGTEVTIYDTTATDSPYPAKDGEQVWMVRCDAHGTQHRVKTYGEAKAAMGTPTKWCQECSPKA